MCNARDMVWVDKTAYQQDCLAQLEQLYTTGTLATLSGVVGQYTGLGKHAEKWSREG